MALKLYWQKCTDGWCSFYRLNLESITVETGVYVIWKPGNPAPVIRLGQGNIVDRLTSHRQDTAITKHGNDLLVTYAEVDARYLDGVERYLADQYSPLVGDRFPNVAPIAVNLLGS